MSEPYGIRKPSIQRFPRPVGTDAVWLAEHYFDWLGRAIPAVSTIVREDVVSIFIWPFGRPAIDMREVRGSSDRVLYRVRGGFLVASHEGGEFEFRELDERTFQVELRGFDPALPRFVYPWTQGWMHDFVMWAFGRHLQRFDRPALPAEESEA